MITRTIQELAEYLRVDLQIVLDAANQTDIFNGPAEADDYLSPAEQADVRAIIDPLDVDGTPHEQWRNTDGAPDTPWSED